jgi:uncharacterized protein
VGHLETYFLNSGYIIKLMDENMKIDAHIHFTPPSLGENLAEFSEQEPYWGLLLTPDPVNHTEQGWATPEQMIEDMDEAGIDKVVLLGVYRHTTESCADTNNETLDIIRRWPDRVIGFSVVQPTPVETALDELHRCLDGGMMGMGEMNPYGQKLVFDDPRFLRMAEACIENDIPMNLHVNSEVGHFALGKTVTPLVNYYHLATLFPELKLILAHWGGGLFLYEMMPEVKRVMSNVWYDTAGTPLNYPVDTMFKAALTCVSHEKLLYGSDYPILLYPPTQTKPDFKPFLEELDNLDVDADVYADIMGLNVARLLGLVEDKKDLQAKSKATDAAQKVKTNTVEPAATGITQHMPVRAIASAWPETQAVFDKHNLPWQDCPVPFWAPLSQTAAAQGFGPTARRRLLEELNEAIGKDK